MANTENEKKFWDYGDYKLSGYQQSGDIHGKYFGTWLRQLDDGKVIIISFGDETKRYWLQIGNCFHGNYATPERAALEAEKLLDLDLPVNYNNLSQAERRIVRERYISLQNGNCSFCGEPLNGPPRSDISAMKLHMKFFPIGFLKAPVHLHHDHHTGMTIGAVHGYCNGVLWQYYGE